MWLPGVAVFSHGNAFREQKCLKFLVHGATLWEIVVYPLGHASHKRGPCFQAWALSMDSCKGIDNHRGSEPSPVGSGNSVAELHQRAGMWFTAWCTQQCSTASERAAMMMKSRVSGGIFGGRESLCIGVLWYYVTGCLGNHGAEVARSGEQGQRSKTSHLLYRSGSGSSSRLGTEAARDLIVLSGSRPSNT